MLPATAMRRLEALGAISQQGKRLNGLFRLMGSPARHGVTTFFTPKIPAKKLSYSSMNGNTGKSFRVAWEKALDLPSS